MLPDNTLDIIIPVYNGEAFIVKCLHAALATANILNANVIVALNKCTDATPNLLSKFNDRRLLIVRAPNFLSVAHNFANALNRSKAKYIVLCGADDELNPIGQKKLAQNFMQTATKPFVLYGYDTIIDINDKPRRSHHAYYSSCFSEHQYVYRSFIAKNPNQNGSWIKRDFFDRVWSQINLDKTPGLERVSDQYFWCFCITELLQTNKLRDLFCYCHAPTIFYREYFDKTFQYRDPRYPRLGAEGRIYFSLYCINNYKQTLPTEFHPAALRGISIYIVNNIFVIASYASDSPAYLNWLNTISNAKELYAPLRIVAFLLANKRTKSPLLDSIYALSILKSRLSSIKNLFLVIFYKFIVLPR